MDIKKADSKGRVSGFEPGKYYSVVRDGLNIILNPLHEGGYTGTGNSLYGLVHKAVLYEDERVIPAASISPRHKDRWWDSDNAKWVYPDEDRPVA